MGKSLFKPARIQSRGAKATKDGGRSRRGAPPSSLEAFAPLLETRASREFKQQMARWWRGRTDAFVAELGAEPVVSRLSFLSSLPTGRTLMREGRRRCARVSWPRR